MKGSLFKTLAMIGIVIVALYYHNCSMGRVVHRAAQAALAKSNLEAEQDSTRIASATQEILGDSMRAVERRAVQEEQKADSIDLALRRERLLKANLEARVRELTNVVVASDVPVTVDSGDVRKASLDYRKVPWTVQLDVALPPPPQVALWTINKIGIDPLRLEVRPGCGPPDEHGIRPATVAVIGPEWAPIDITRVTQSAELCQSPALQPSGWKVPGWTLPTTGIIVAVVTLLVLGFR